MALKHLCACIFLIVATSACSRPAPATAEDEPEALSVTRWTDKTELFAEYPPLSVGETSRFAIHLTRLDSFKALTAGRVEVRLRGSAGAKEVFSADAPSRPGIFGVDVKPVHPGNRELVITLRSAGLDDQHTVGEVEVYGNAGAARASAVSGAEDAHGISFLKEQLADRSRRPSGGSGARGAGRGPPRCPLRGWRLHRSGVGRDDANPDP